MRSRHAGCLDRMVGYRISPLSMGQSQERFKCRTCTVCGTPDHLQTERMRSTLLSRRSTGAWMRILPDSGREKASEQPNFTEQSKEENRYLHNEEELNEILAKLEGMPSIRCGDVKKGERSQESPASLYYQYPAAGGLQGSEFLHPENHADRPAAL